MAILCGNAARPRAHRVGPAAWQTASMTVPPPSGDRALPSLQRSVPSGQPAAIAGAWWTSTRRGPTDGLAQAGIRICDDPVPAPTVGSAGVAAIALTATLTAMLTYFALVDHSFAAGEITAFRETCAPCSVGPGHGTV